MQIPRIPKCLQASQTQAEESIVPKIVFLGPPGVGKGTYAKRIAKWLNVPHIAVGDLLREEMKLQTEVGKEVRESLLRTGIQIRVGGCKSNINFPFPFRFCFVSLFCFV